MNNGVYGIDMPTTPKLLVMYQYLKSITTKLLKSYQTKWFSRFYTIFCVKKQTSVVYYVCYAFCPYFPNIETSLFVTVVFLMVRATTQYTLSDWRDSSASHASLYNLPLWTWQWTSSLEQPRYCQTQHFWQHSCLSMSLCLYLGLQAKLLIRNWNVF